MQQTFSLVAAIGLAYFCFARRRVDLLTVGFCSACVYFLPGFVGEVIYPLEASTQIGVYLQIDFKTYLVMILVLVAILATALLLNARGSSIQIDPVLNQRTTARRQDFLCECAVFWALIGCAMTWFTVGSEVLFSVNKNLILDEFSRWSVLWSIGSVVGLISAVDRGRPLLGSICGLLIVFEVYIGFRASMAIALIGSAYILLAKRGPIRLVPDNKVLILAGLVLGFFLFVYKFIYIQMKAGEFEAVLDLLMNPALYEAAFSHSEPFVTQAILNQVLIEDYRVGWSHLSGLLTSFIIFAPELGLNSVGFNELVQPHLFGSITDSGIAANIWAEAYSIAGWPLLILVILLFPISLAIGSRWIANISPPTRAFLVAGACFWGFYIHRNDLLFQVTLEKRVLIFFCLCWISNRAVLMLRVPCRSSVQGATVAENRS